MKTVITLNTSLINHLCVGMYGTLIDPDFMDEWNDDDRGFNFGAYKEYITDKFNETIEDYGTLEASGVSIKFEGLKGAKIHSPREYNFTTDSIQFLVAYDLDEMKALVKANYAQFDQYLTDNYTSHDGFFSFTPNNAVDWLVQANSREERAIAAFINYWDAYHGGFFADIQKEFEDNVLDLIHEVSHEFFEEIAA
ncbi:hypothetical protein [Marinicella marina]|uniref:hypothetical protein n=1 Tax=Marinicella marina TaxID=2996016 RepID=UPI0024BCDA39|nr:hypothetical protein [Marinicella marina]MDJ1139618.1 hypothetical protein [Marinicella marina]